MLVTACILDSKKDDGSDAPGTRRLFVITSDYTSGALLSYSLDSLKRGPDSLQVNQDSRVLSLRKAIYVLERFGANNLLKYDPATKMVVYQKHVLGNCNPSDLVALNDEVGFLTVEDSAKILQVNLRTGDTVKSLNISEYTYLPPSGSGSAAASPHAVRAALRGDTLYVALQRRNGNYMFEGGLAVVLRIRASTFAIIDTLTAPAKNASDMWLDGNNLYLTCLGKYGTLDGGLYRWNLSTKVVSTVFTEATLGADVSGLVCGDSGACVVHAYVAYGHEPVRRLNLNTGALNDTLASIGEASGGVAADAQTGIIYVGDRKATASGIRMYNSAGVMLRGPVFTGLPPYSLTVGEF
ncbi:MAG TPA: hypothetical protein DCQ83_00155 [Fibrobacteres bacterium]|jgi:DNA-binding beta-propeller fold protein YncE|nr:hypothetical protein [Fibrobacterota bacterium]